MPGVTETLYGSRIGPLLAWTLARVTGVLPFSLVEMLLAVWISGRLALAARGIVNAARGRRRWRNAVGAGALAAAGDLGIGLALFYFLWGLGYARPPAEERLALPVGETTSTEVVAALAGELVDAVNVTYRELHGSDDAGAPTVVEDERGLEDAIEYGWRRLASELELGAPRTWHWVLTKRPVASPLLHRMGLSGFYSPFTGEANVSASVPAAYRAHTIAHEKAHQRGVQPEDEANFFGFLAGLRAPHPVARYSSLLFAQRQLLGTLLRAGEEETARALIDRRLPGVQRDVDDLNAYWSRHRGAAQRLTRRVNDAYLKTNRVEGGVLSYGGSVDLILAWARSRGGTLAGERSGPGAG